MAQMYDNGDAEIKVSNIGILKVISTSLEISANGTFEINTPIPTGKNWIIHSVSTLKSSGTYTIGANNVKIFPVSAETGAVICSNSGDTNYSLPSPITISDTGKIQSQITVTGYSVTGNYTQRILYSEYDE